MDQEQAEREVCAVLHGMGWFSRANHDNLTDAGREIVARLLGDKRSVLIERMGESRVGIRRKLNSILCHLDDIERKVDRIMASQAELTAQLNTLNDQMTKIGTETTALLAAIADLKVQVQNAPVSAELQAAFDKVAASAKAVDDLVPDQP